MSKHLLVTGTFLCSSCVQLHSLCHELGPRRLSKGKVLKNPVCLEVVSLTAAENRVYWSTE